MPRRTPSAVLLERDERNPILTARDWPYSAQAVFNPGAARLPDGSTLLLCRVEDHRGQSHFCVARSSDGVAGWAIDGEPTLLPAPREHPAELWGIEDPRLTYLPEREAYAVTYTAHGFAGPAVALALTSDFRRFRRYGVIRPPENKDAALFPRRIGDRWALLHRPRGTAGAHMWIAFSPDLRHWGEDRLVLACRPVGWWDAHRIGLATPPIETQEGWLVIYHGVRATVSGAIYRLGLALLDLERPQRCLLRSDRWFFGPEAPYEREGDVNNVVFPCGHVIESDGDTLRLYYGAADTCIALAWGSLKALLRWLKRHGRRPSR